MKINVENRTIFCHDNLDILKGINSNSVDLIYLDPPFNKKKMFTAPIGSSAEGASFKDWFQEKEIKEEWLDTIKQDNLSLHDFLNGIKTLYGRKSYNFCYLSYMAIRLMEMHRVLKPTGSIYLHCDQTMSHYLKLILDCIFGEKLFKNEIVWSYQGPAEPKKAFKRKHDYVLFYTKSKASFFNDDASRESISEFSKSKFTKKDEKGWYKEIKGIKQYMRETQRMKSVWDIPIINAMAKERTGYPTQKPLVLLERIISVSCPKDGIVLDPFCGCATTCVAAEKLNRSWIGIDISHEAYRLVQERLQKQFAQGNIFEKPWKNITYLTYPLKRTDKNGDEGDKKWIYVISNPKYLGEYKVGVAKNWKSRLNSYQTSSPDREYKMEYKVETANFNKIEKTVHNFFGNKNQLKHEWVQAPLVEIKDKINELINDL